MTRALGIDLEAGQVRVAVLRAAYRKVALEHLIEEAVSAHAGPEEALKACLEKVGPVDVICTTLPGAETFVQVLSVPAAAAKRLGDVLPFELEAALPLEIGDVVFDYETLGAAVGGQLPILAVAARKTSVSREIARVLAAAGQEPERVGAAQLEIAQILRLTPTIADITEPICIVRLGLSSTDVCLAVRGEAHAGRTLSIGVAEFPEAAERLVSQLRQTLASFEAHVGSSADRIVLVGEGAAAEGICEFLSARLPVTVEVLPPLGLDGLDELDRAKVPSFALALATASHGLRRSGFDLRQGELAFERGYGFVKDKAPLLSVLGVFLVLSFLFATWAQGRALRAERASLEASLELLTQETFGKKIADPDEAESELSRLRNAKPEDPMPYLDGFGAAVAISETLPKDIVHDIEQLEFSKGRLNVRGIVSTTDEAQRVAKALDEHRCIEGSNVSKISQVVNSERARYVMEAKVLCPEDQVEGDKKPKKVGDFGMKLRGYFDNLAERERRLLLVFFGILGFMVLVFVPVLVRMGVSDMAAQNEKLETAIAVISSERVTVAKRQAQASRLEQRYGLAAPALAGWLAKIAEDVGVEIPETQDRSTVPRGKTFKERSTHIRLSKVGMYKLSNFMEKVSVSNYPVVISRLDIKKRSGKPDEYDAEMDITAFDHAEKKAVKKAVPKGAATEGSSAEDGE